MKHLKLFESGENYKIIATNNSYYNYEYDSIDVTAQILLDISDNSLYLKIRKVHVKSGLGSGTFPRDVEFIRIGNLQKADLALVRSLLKKHGYEQRKFSKFWEDDEGNKMSLTDLLNMHKPTKPAKELKHIKSITNFDNPIVNQDIELVKYSDRSYAIFGEGTKQIKDKLNELGCKYNRFLTDPKTGQKRAGWIFPIGKLDKIKQLL